MSPTPLPSMNVAGLFRSARGTVIENFRQRYELGNATVVISSLRDVANIEQLLVSLIRLAKADDQQSCLQDSDLLFEFVPQDIELEVPEMIGQTTATDDLQGRKTQDGYYWWCGNSTLQLFSDDARVIVQIGDDFRGFPLFLQRQFFLMAFYMLLRRVGQYCLHANGVVHQNNAFLIAGSSGSGKSTLSLTLALQAGWRYWGDDTIALRLASEEVVTGMAVRCGTACSAKTATVSAETQALFEKSPLLQDDKRFLDIESLNAVSVVQEANPTILLFPTIQDQKHSVLEPVDQTSTMARLIAVSAGILTNRDEVQLQMSLLEKLSRQARSYSMIQGRDAIEEPERVADLLASTGLTD